MQRCNSLKINLGVHNTLSMNNDNVDVMARDGPLFSMMDGEGRLGCDFVRQIENSYIAKTGCSSIRSSNRDFVYTNRGTDSRNCPFSVLYSF